MRRDRGRRLSLHAGGRRRRALLTRFRLGELVGAIGGLGLLVALFLTWYTFDVTWPTSGWEAFSVTDIVLAAAAVVAMSVGACVLFRISVSYPVAGSSVAAGLGAVSVILIVIRMINPPDSGAVDLEFGAWLGLASAIAIAVGGYLGMQDAGPVRTPSAAQ